MLVVFTAIIIMTVRKKFLKRKLDINQQYEVELNRFDDRPKSFELDNQLRKRLGELPLEPIYDCIDELSIKDFNIKEEECRDIHKQNCSSELQEESTLKTNELLNPLDNFDEYTYMNGVVIPDN